jgi:shikimate kinase
MSGYNVHSTFAVMRIYLIGFMGAGKSTLGAHVALQLNVPFVDTDLLIEEEKGMPIPEIFSIEGEDHFRLYEASALRSTAEIEKGLIACGGGLPVYHRNMEWLNEHGITMYLQIPDDILLASLVQHRSMRPLLAKLCEEQAVHKAMDLLKELRPVYEQASMTIEMTGDFALDVQLLEKACKYIW